MFRTFISISSNIFDEISTVLETICDKAKVTRPAHHINMITSSIITSAIITRLTDVFACGVSLQWGKSMCAAHNNLSDRMQTFARLVLPCSAYSSTPNENLVNPSMKWLGRNLIANFAGLSLSIGKRCEIGGQWARLSIDCYSNSSLDWNHIFCFRSAFFSWLIHGRFAQLQLNRIELNWAERSGSDGHFSYVVVSAGAQLADICQGTSTTLSGGKLWGLGLSDPAIAESLDFDWPHLSVIGKFVWLS